jgi:DNA-binding transcriptional ArsR family regulator
LSDRHKALAAPNRLRILHLLADRTRTVTEVASLLQLSVSNASRHLALLAAGGLVERVRRGRRVRCRLSSAGVSALSEAAAADRRGSTDTSLTNAASSLRAADPDDVELQIVMGASLFPHAARTREEWDKQMIELFGVSVRSHLPTIYAASLRTRRGEPLDDLPLPPALLAGLTQGSR